MQDRYFRLPDIGLGLLPVCGVAGDVAPMVTAGLGTIGLYNN